MTREEAREELIEEWNEFIDGCGLRGIEEKEAKRNPDFKKVYEANLMAIQALQALEDIRAEIKELPYQRIFGSVSSYSLLDTVIEIIDKHISGEEQERSE